MPTLITSFLLASWFMVGTFLPNLDKGLPESQNTSGGISLIEHTAFPDIKPVDISFLDSFETTQHMLSHLDSATPAELKRWFQALLKTSNPSQEILELIITRLASKAPEGTFAYLKSTEGIMEPYVGSEMYAIALLEWSHKDLPSAIDAALTREEFEFVILALVDKIDPDKQEAVYQELLQRGLDKTSGVFLDLFTKLVKHDPQTTAERALAYTLRPGAGLSDKLGLELVMGEWFAADPDAALQWAIGQEDSKERALALSTFAKVSAHKDGPEGLDRVWHLLDDQQRMGLAADMLN